MILYNTLHLHISSNQRKFIHIKFVNFFMILIQVTNLSYIFPPFFNFICQGSINKDEFEELRKVDYEYRRETVMDESEKLKLALDALGKIELIWQLLSDLY